MTNSRTTKAEINRELLRRAAEVRRIQRLPKRRRNTSTQDSRFAEDLVSGIQVTVALYSKAMKALGDY